MLTEPSNLRTTCYITSSSPVYNMLL